MSPNVSSSVSESAELWICFDLPPEDPPKDAVVLSFMSPRRELEAEERWGARLLNGRAWTEDVRPDARRLYLDLLVCVGATPIAGKTLRQVLKGRDGYSRWWFLKTSEKDSIWEGDFYTTLLRLICIKRVADKYGIQRVRLYGALSDFEAAVAGRFTMAPSGYRWPDTSFGKAVGIALLGRLSVILFYVRLWWTLKFLPRRPAEHVDVLLEAHWNWSVMPDATGALQDRYFSDLPAKLEQTGIRVGWAAWCEPARALWRGRRTLAGLAAESVKYPGVVLLERFLCPGDILREAADFRYLLRFLRFERVAAFRELCRVEGFDLYPLMRKQIVPLLCSASLCRWELLVTAMRRACEQIQPRMLLTFLEVFLHSRALYVGARLGAPAIKLWAAQHTVYSSDRTFGTVDPKFELQGEPDACPVPAPEGVFAMGELARKIWERNGFSSERVIVTGGLRYQHVRMEGPKTRLRTEGRAAVLLVASMTQAADLEMCEAVTMATQDLPLLQVRLRDHPLYRLSDHTGFKAFRRNVVVTAGTADEDLASADLVVFTHSALAEEALLLGIPVWQWRWAGVNASVFLDIPVIPVFDSVSALRRALEAFLENPAGFAPTRGAQEMVLHQCFGPDPARASARVTDEIVELLG